VTLATRITLSRLVLLPVFCLLVFLYTPEREWLRFAALGLYILMALTDAADGYVARRFNQRTRFGARLDPLADKLVVNLALVFLAANRAFHPPIPLWFPVYILSRDIIIVLGAFAIQKYRGQVTIAPSISGKATTVLQMSTIIAALLTVSFLPWLLWATVALSLLSLLQYIHVGVLQVVKRKSA